MSRPTQFIDQNFVDDKIWAQKLKHQKPCIEKVILTCSATLGGWVKQPFYVMLACVDVSKKLDRWCCEKSFYIKIILPTNAPKNGTH